MDSIQPSTPPEHVSPPAVVIFGALIGVTNQIEPVVGYEQRCRATDRWEGYSSASLCEDASRERVYAMVEVLEFLCRKFSDAKKRRARGSAVPQKELIN